MSPKPRPSASRNRRILTEEEIAVAERTPAYPSQTFKTNWLKARKYLGLSLINRRSYPKLSKFTTLAWKFKAFEDNYIWIWAEYIRLTDADRSIKRGLLMAQMISKVYGIALVDLRGPSRDATIVMPRMIGMAMLRFDGLSYGEIRRAFHKDQKTAAYASQQMQKYIGKLDARTNSRRPALSGQPTGRISAPLPEVATGDGDQVEAETDSPDGGPDRGEG
jgi:hypothetical protein